MELKDLAVNLEKLEDVRGGAAIGQGIFNGGTAGFSLAVGGDVNSQTSSVSNVTSAHLNTQDAVASDSYRRIMEIRVEASKNVLVGRAGLVRL